MEVSHQDFTRLLGVLERIATALEGGQQVNSAKPAMIPNMRERVCSVFADEWVSIDQVRDGCGLNAHSGKAVGMMLADAGFERRRFASGVRYYVNAEAAQAAPPPSPVGAPVKLPEDIDAKVEWYFGSKFCTPPHTPLQFLNQHYGATGWGKTHEVEMHRRWPGQFATTNVRGTR